MIIKRAYLNKERLYAIKKMLCTMVIKLYSCIYSYPLQSILSFFISVSNSLDSNKVISESISYWTNRYPISSQKSFQQRP